MKTPSPNTADRSEPWIQEVEFYRKLLHLSSLAAPLGVIWWGRLPVLFILGLGSFLALAGQLLQVRSRWANERIERVFGSMMRPHEKRSVGDPIRLNGATWLTVSAFLIFLCFPASTGVAAFSLAVIGDTAAAFVGIRWGHHSIYGTQKTVEGSLAFFVTGLLTVTLLLDLPVWKAAIAALGGTAAEACTVSINDNLLVPFVCGTILILL
jgi:dolichol kinase